jgi:hypothetical protein
MKKVLLALALLTGLLAFSERSFAQCDTVATICAKHMTKQYVSDGQRYFSLLLDQEVAEFSATFYGGTTYRIAQCSGLSDGNLVVVIYDKEKNVLFTNAEYQNAPYWDFKFKSTIDCTIEAVLNPSTNTTGSGCAVLLISFQQ